MNNDLISRSELCLDVAKYHRGSCDCLTCDDCIRQPIPADIAKKLGIRPKEV